MRSLSAVSILLALLIATDWLPILRGPQEWRWPLLSASIGDWFIGGVAIALFLLVWQGLQSYQKKHPRIALSILFFIAILVQLAILTTERSNPASLLFERLASNQISGYFTVAQEIDAVGMRQFLQEFPQRMPLFTPDAHPHTKPPGIILAYWGLEKIVQVAPSLTENLAHASVPIRCADLWLITRSDAALSALMLMGILTVVLSASLIFPVHYLLRVRGLHAGAWLAAGLAALLPSRILFVPNMDVVYPLLTILALVCVDKAVRNEKPFSWIILAGLLLSLLTFFSLANMFCCIVIGLYLLFLCREKGAWRAFFQYGALLFLSTFIIWLMFWLYAQVTPLDIFQAAGGSRDDQLRTYTTWLWGNFYDYAIFVGTPVFLLAIVARKGKLTGLFVAFWLMIIGLALSGTMRGEVGRTWLMIAPFPLLLVGANWRDADEKNGIWLITAVSLFTLVLGLRWQLSALEWPAPEPVLSDSVAESADYVGKWFDDIELHSSDIVDNDDTVTLDIFWEANGHTRIPYTVFTQLIDKAGNVVAQQDSMPKNGQLPTTCWQPEQLIADQYILPTNGLQSGDYAIHVGLYDAKTGARLSRSDGETSLILGEISR